MIVHRDYRTSADSIVKIYTDRIEFFNPGRLRDTISILVKNIEIMGAEASIILLSEELAFARSTKVAVRWL